jgi:hypothetical protein
MGLFGPGDLFLGSNLDGQESPNGLNYGITSAGDDPTTGSSAVTGETPLIQESVLFTLSGFPGELTAGSVGNVHLQYGTSLCEPELGGTSGVPLVPEPSTLFFFVAGGLLVAFRARRFMA